MIEPTEEMVHDIRHRIGGSEVAARSAADAVLAIVERDYELRPRGEDCLCGADLGAPWDSVAHRRGTRGCRHG